jgi:hypothetical protein
MAPAAKTIGAQHHYFDGNNKRYLCLQVSARRRRAGALSHSRQLFANAMAARISQQNLFKPRKPAQMRAFVI